MLEYEEVLKREVTRFGLTWQDIDDLIDGICSIANKHRIFFRNSTKHALAPNEI